MNEMKAPKILVIRLSSLGDVVLTTAIFPNFKAHWPDCNVTVLTKPAFASVFDNNPSVDSVRVFDPKVQPFSQLAQEIKMQGYDIIVDLHGNPRSFFLRLLTGAPVTVVARKNTVARYALMLFKRSHSSLQKSVRERILDCLIPLDVPIKHTDTQLFPEKKWDALLTLGVDPTKKLIGLAPGAKHNTKRWGVEHYAEAGNRLGAFPNTQVLVLGDKSDKPVAEEVFRRLNVPAKNLAGWTSLKELINIVSRLSLLMTNDSGIMHVGEALNIPLVAMFGPTVKGFGFYPYKPTSRVAEVINLHCRPCTLHGSEACPLKHHRCMADLDVNAALLVASDLLEKSPPAEPVA